MEKLIPPLLRIARRAGEAILDVYQSDFAVEMKDDRSPLTEADKRSHEIISAGLKSLPQDTWPVMSEEGIDTPFGVRKHWTRYWLVDPLDGTKEFIKRNGEFTVNIALIQQKTPVLGVVLVPVRDEVYFAAAGLGSFKADAAAVAGRELSYDEIIGLSSPLPLASPEEPVLDGEKRKRLTIVGSRSHLSPEVNDYVDGMKKKYDEVLFVSAGSSLKFCLVAEGKADVYPRLGPTMEWDTAAGQAVVTGAGGSVDKHDAGGPLNYNKENLLNPWFIVRSESFQG